MELHTASEPLELTCHLELDAELARNRDQARSISHLSWEQARNAVRDAFERAGARSRP